MSQPVPAARSPRAFLLAHWPALALVALLLAVYLPLVTWQALPVSDDGFTSDLLDGEFPLRVAAGRALAQGEAPTWLSTVYGGIPLLAGTGAGEPLSLLLFTLLPPVAALDTLVVLLLCVAALGAYRLARALGAGQAGALLCGIAFAQSGFLTCQLRHLSVLTTVAFFPWALVALEAALVRLREGVRPALGAFALFGLIFGEQALAGFPQSLYIAGLVYGAWALVRLVRDRQLPGRRRWAGLGLAALAVTLGAALGAVQLLPLAELASVSTRAQGVSAEFVGRWSYWLPDAWSFVVPYLHGDASEGTYTGKSIFWEAHAYLGLLTVVCAVGALARVRRAPLVVALWALALVAFAMALGPATPLFPLAFRFLPGMSMFRLPTRFLFVVALALALLGALGLTFLEERFARLREQGRWQQSPALVPFLLALLTAADVTWANARQNTLDDADPWMAPPPTVQRLRELPPGRVFTPGWGLVHKSVARQSRGWSGDLAMHYVLRGFLQPQIGLLWGVDTADGYMGLSPRWTHALWGDHNGPGLLSRTWTMGEKGLVANASFFRLLRMNDVRVLLSPVPIEFPQLQPLAVEGPVHMYAVRDVLPRARLVARAWPAPDDAAAGERLLAADFDPAREVIVHDPPAQPAAADLSQPGAASVRTRTSTSVTVDVQAAAPAWLVLAETWYPGWHASVDGAEVPLMRANLNQRAVQVPAGAHEVRFWFAAPSVRTGLVISLGALLVLLVLLVAGVRRRAPANLAEGV